MTAGHVDDSSIFTGFDEAIQEFKDNGSLEIDKNRIGGLLYQGNVQAHLILKCWTQAPQFNSGRRPAYGKGITYQTISNLS